MVGMAFCDFSQTGRQCFPACFCHSTVRNFDVSPKSPYIPSICGVGILRPHTSRRNQTHPLWGKVGEKSLYFWSITIQETTRNYLSIGGAGAAMAAISFMGMSGGSGPPHHERGAPEPGGRLQCEMPGCVCWGSENVPILKDAVGQKNIPILKGSSAHFL